jgi:hypothetical protein
MEVMEVTGIHIERDGSSDLVVVDDFEGESTNIFVNKTGFFRYGYLQR